MPPFRLELPDRVTDRTQYRMIHTKRIYEPSVKVHDWDKKRDTRPIDDDPYCPGNINLCRSHYRRFGTEQDTFISTTMEMLNQVYTKDNYSYTKLKNPFVNYVNYRDWLPCEERDILCPTRCAPDFLSTMQYSYTPPYSYAMKRISCPSVPYLRNRKLKKEDPILSTYKFYDEGFKEVTDLLRKHKMSHWKSFNPCTGDYNDGTSVPMRSRDYPKLEYDD